MTAAATVGSAQALGLADVGTIEAGSAADLVVMNCNPLEDVRALTRPSDLWMVVKAGRVVAR